MAIIGGAYGQTWILVDDTVPLCTDNNKDIAQFEEAQIEHERIVNEIDRIKAGRNKG